MKNNRIFWGIFFILAAVYVVVSKLGILPDIGVFGILITVFLLWLVVQGIRHINFYEILFPIACICIIYDEPLQITALTPWTVLGAALLGSIGLSMIFHGKRKKWRVKKYTGKCEWSGAGSEPCSGEQIYFKNNFGSAIRYIESDNFQCARVENNFGTLSVYFDNAIVQCKTAYVNVDNNFGETNLYIPKEWQVQNHLSSAFGAINEIGASTGTGSTVFHINGTADFGVINLYYI